MATFNRPRQTRPTPASAVLTQKSASDAANPAANDFAAGLRAGIRRALDVSRLPESQFVNRQIAIHREFHSRQTQKSAVATRLQTVMKQLEDYATNQSLSGRKLAALIGITERSWRRLKTGRADAERYLGQLETAVTRLEVAHV